ncbi:MAG TPA: hypothetical protein VHJ34_10855 [Actinomycetota bacterium]|nr:hypothetical protein [Actinomycetota bacterium]
MASTHGVGSAADLELTDDQFQHLENATGIRGSGAHAARVLHGLGGDGERPPALIVACS